MTVKYCGLIWGRVYTANNIRIKDAESLFWDENPDLYIEISDYIFEHVRKYIHVGYFQSGFGGDDQDGCIDYAWDKPVPKIDPMQFEINGRKYIMRFSAPPNTIE
jgi:hypothetical protein